ncbi:MAG: RICIN domain-containing protein, partial [Clostridia bacterium]|nr:RICIN domain-containing protein [Clostridia bacterium]
AAVFAASEVPADPTPVDSAPESPVETESLLTADLKKQIVPEAEVPDLIDYSVAVEEKYVCRAYWEETDLNEVVFLKSDGTLARYYFAIPVKYEENGEVFDKKPALVERETLLNNLYRYELTAQNDTAFYCPDNLTHGFLYQGGDMEVALRPITQSEYDFLRGHANAGDLVLPGNILPEGYDSQAVTGVAQSALSVTDEETTAARYVLSTEGEQVNSVVAGQDILSAVPSYNGFQLQLDLAEGALTQTVYFELDSELLPIPTEGGLLLCDRKGNPVGILGDLLSESGVSNDIPWTVTESLSGTYLLSATLPRNGQTYTLSTTNLFDYLLDASIYSADQENYGQSANLWVGYHQSYSGIERVLIRPNNWYFTETAISNQVVQSATLTIRDITVTTPEEDIEVRPFFGGTWEENYVNWTDFEAVSYGPVLDSNPVSSAIGWNEGYYYSYDITPLVQNWYTGVSNWQKGLIIRWDEDDSATSTMEKCFASSQYSNENYRPRLEITTAALSTIESGVYYINPAAAVDGYRFSANPVAVDNDATTGAPNSSTVYIQETGQANAFHQMWRITHIQNNYYTIRPYHYTAAGLYASGTSAVTSHLGYSDLWEEVSSGFLWYIGEGSVPSGGDPSLDYLYVQPFGSGFRLQTYSATTTGTVSLGDDYGGIEHKWIFSKLSNPQRAVLYYSTAAGIRDLNPIYSIYAGDSRNLKSIGLLVSMSVPNEVSLDVSSYSWKTSDSEIVEYDSTTGRSSSEGLGIVYVWPDVSFASQYEYYFRISSYGEGTYYLRNEASGRYLDVSSDFIDVGGRVSQSDFDADPLSEFIFIRHENGYYTIHPATDTNYCLAAMLNPDDEYEVFLNWTSYDDSCYWNVGRTNSGNFKIATKLNTAMVLSLDPESSGSILGSSIVLTSYSNNDDYRDEWFITEYAYQLSLYSYYDQKFIDRNGENTVERIQEQMDTLKAAYKEYLGIKINLLCLEKTTTYLEDCVAASNDEVCRHSCHTMERNGVTYYYTDKLYFFYNVLEQNLLPCTYGYVYWIGYDFGNDSNAECVSLISGEMPDVWHLIHEVSHQFNASDHYCNDGTTDICLNPEHCENAEHVPASGEKISQRPNTCAMDNDLGSWMAIEANGAPFCEDCKTEIFAHAEQNGHAIP